MWTGRGARGNRGILSHQGPPLATVVLEDKTYTATPVAIEVHAGVIAGEITDIQVVQQVERSSGRVISLTLLLPRLMGALRLWSSSGTHSVPLVVAKIQYLDDQWRPTKLEDSPDRGELQVHHLTAADVSTPGRRRSTRST